MGDLNKYQVVSAPDGWTVEVNSADVQLLGVLVDQSEYNLGALRAVYSGGLAPAGATITPPGGIAANITGVAADAAANVCEVTITVVDVNGDAVAAVHNMDVWLSDATSGAGLTATTASGTVTAKSASGAVMGTDTSKKALRVQTLATGIFILEITDTAKTAFKVCATLNGKAIVLCTLATADYGS